MKKLSTFLTESKLNIQEETINYISVADLKKYLEITDKFISQEAKTVIQYLIDNNTSYVNDFGNSVDGNALATFYSKGVPSDSNLKPIYKAIGILSKNERLIEIPVFQNEDQFNDIINKKVAPDEILLDLTSERGRNKVANKYYPLIVKMAKQYSGKSNLTFDELVSAGYEGLTYAMNGYGKCTGKKQQEYEATLSDEEQQLKDEKRKSYTFGQYAAYMIRMVILSDIENISRTVRIPKSAQQKERNETGRNTKQNTVSGQSAVGTDKDGNEKTLFDKIGNSEKAGKGLDQEDIEYLWSTIHKKLGNEFSERDLNVFYSYYGINGHEKIQGKQLASKYNIGASTVTAILWKVKQFLYKNCNSALNELNALYHEALQNKYEEENDDIFIISNTNNND